MGRRLLRGRGRDDGRRGRAGDGRAARGEPGAGGGVLQAGELERRDGAAAREAQEAVLEAHVAPHDERDRGSRGAAAVGARVVGRPGPGPDGDGRGRAALDGDAAGRPVLARGRVVPGKFSDVAEI